MGHLDLTLLIVEDEGLIAADIAASAEDSGYGTVVVPSVAQAHQALREAAIAGAILDFRVADGDTASLARCLRLFGIPYAVVSASPRHDLARAGIEPERIFNKPAQYRNVIEALQQRYGLPRAA